MFFLNPFSSRTRPSMHLRFFSCYFSWCWLKVTFLRAIRFVSVWRLTKVKMTLACSCLMGRVCLVFKIVWKNKFKANIFYWVLCWRNIIPPALCRNFDHFEMKFSRNSIVSTSKQRRNFDVDSICVFDSFFEVVLTLCAHWVERRVMRSPG